MVLGVPVMRVPCGCCMPARLRTACLHTASTLHVCVVGRPVLRAPCTRDALRDLRDPCCMPACLRTACAVRKDANLQKEIKFSTALDYLSGANNL